MQIIKEINSKISKYILQLNLLTNDSLLTILDKIDLDKDRLDDYLIANGILSTEQINNVITKFINVKLSNIDLIAYDEQLIASLPEDFVVKTKILPLRLDVVNGENVYTIALGDCLDENVKLTAQTIFGYNSSLLYTTKDKLLSLNSLISTKFKVANAIKEYDDETKDLNEDENLESAQVTTAPAVKLAENILKEAIASKASDIHIEPYEEIVRVRCRIDGVLYEKTTFDTKLYPALVTRFKIISSLNITERRIPQDGRFNIVFNDQTYDFRLSTLPCVYGEKIVIRILDKSAFALTLENLGFNEEALKIIKPILKIPHGIILLTGPTGCGKSTTLYSFIREINDTGVNIVSVEDPVEYTIKGINQVQVNSKINMTFASALRSILRQDPNVIMIGEIRDEETASIAIRSAITGHLVFSTLHTNDAPGAVARLSDMGVESYLVADALEMVIAQRLVRKLCPECKKKIRTTSIQNKILGLSKSQYIYAPVGCPACHNTGYKGRTGIHEILIVDNELREIIVNKKSTEEIYNYLENKNFKNLRSSCIEAILNGTTSFQEYYTISQEEE